MDLVVQEGGPQEHGARRRLDQVLRLDLRISISFNVVLKRSESYLPGQA